MKYPGLIHRLSVLMWQRGLVKGQVDDETTDTEVDDDGERS